MTSATHRGAHDYTRESCRQKGMQQVSLTACILLGARLLAALQQSTLG